MSFILYNEDIETDKIFSLDAIGKFKNLFYDPKKVKLFMLLKRNDNYRIYTGKYYDSLKSLIEVDFIYPILDVLYKAKKMSIENLLELFNFKKNKKYSSIINAHKNNVSEIKNVNSSNEKTNDSLDLNIIEDNGSIDNNHNGDYDRTKNPSENGGNREENNRSILEDKDILALSNYIIHKNYLDKIGDGIEEEEENEEFINLVDNDDNKNEKTKKIVYNLNLIKVKKFIDTKIEGIKKHLNLIDFEIKSKEEKATKKKMKLIKENSLLNKFIVKVGKPNEGNKRIKKKSEQLDKRVLGFLKLFINIDLIDELYR